MMKRWAGLAVMIATFLLYITTRSQNYSADSILYALAIESGRPSWLLDPYHLLLHPLGWLFYQVWRLGGWPGGALLPLQVLNALGGAVSVGLIYAIGQRIGASLAVSCLVAAGFAVSGAVWLLSVEAEFITVPLAIALLVLWGVLGTRARRAGEPSYALLMGCGVALAILTYLTSAFLVPVVIGGLLLHRELAWPVQRRQVVILGSTVLILTIPALSLLSGSWTGGNWSQLAALVDGGGSYGQLAWGDLPHGVYAFLRSLALYPGLGMNDSTRVYMAGATGAQRALFTGYYAVVLAVAALPLWLGFHRRRRLWPVHHRRLGVLLVWTLLYAAFAVYWVPGDVSFWVPVLSAWWLLVALLVVATPDPRSVEQPDFSVRPGQPVPGYRWELVALTGAVAWLGVANGALLILPRHDLARNGPYHLAMSLAEHTAADDLIVTRADDLSLLYITYFAGRQVFPLRPESSGLGTGLDALAREAARVQARGGRVFVVGFQPQQDASADALPGIDADSGSLPWSKGSPSWQLRGETVWELLP